MPIPMPTRPAPPQPPVRQAEAAQPQQTFRDRQARPCYAALRASRMFDPAAAAAATCWSCVITTTVVPAALSAVS